MQRFIDIHAHIFPEKIADKATRAISDFYGFDPYSAKHADAEHLKKHAVSAGAEHVVVCSTATVPKQVENINTWISVFKNDGVLIPMGTIHPDFEDVEAEVERIISLGLWGIKLHPDFQKFDADCEKAHRIYRCMEKRLPLLIHAGDSRYDFSAPRRIATVHEKFPGLTIIAAHLGGYSQWEEAEEYILGNDIYIDTSSAISFMEPERATEIILKHGTDRVLFGTDYPLRSQNQELKTFEKLILTQVQREAILYDNARRLLGEFIK